VTAHVAGLNDAALQEVLEKHAGIDLGGGVTISRRENYTFLNFGFLAK
jgi:hypothetical protein